MNKLLQHLRISSNELEYSVFKLLDGGVTPISSSWQDPNTSRNDDIFEALKQLRQELGFDLSAEIQEIEEQHLRLLIKSYLCTGSVTGQHDGLLVRESWFDSKSVQH